MALILDIEPPPGCQVRFISDLHLAHKRSLAPTPRELLSHMEGVGMLVLCGDTGETRETCVERDRSIALRAELRRLCIERGIQLVELAGNHDPDTEPMLARLWGGKVVAMHGHQLMPAVSPWSREYLRCKQQVQSILHAYPHAEHDLTANLERAAAVARELSRRVPGPTQRGGRNPFREFYHCFWPPQRPLRIVSAWLTCGRRAESWARRFTPEAELLIIGHYHRSGRWQFGSRTILNTGAWFEHARPYAVDVCDARLLRHFPLPPGAR